MSLTKSVVLVSFKEEIELRYYNCSVQHGRRRLRYAF